MVLTLSPTLMKPLHNMFKVTGRKTMVRENPNSRLGVGLKLIFWPSTAGWAGWWWPAMSPKKNSQRIGPSQLRKLGSRHGDVLLSRIMSMGSALLLYINGPSRFGPHHRLWRPTDN